IFFREKHARSNGGAELKSVTQDISRLAALGPAVLTNFGIDAIVLEHQPRDRCVTQKMRLYDLVEVLGLHAAIPNCVGINHHIGAVLALIKAARLVGAKAMSQSALGKFLFKSFLQRGIALRIAAAARAGGIALVGTYKDMFLVLRHGTILEERQECGPNYAGTLRYFSMQLWCNSGSP